VAEETWRQLGQHVEKVAGISSDRWHYLPDSALTDPNGGLRSPRPTREGENVPRAASENHTLTNDEKLLINTAGSWDHRPTARTAFENLVVAGDYVRTRTDFASMEGANEAGRRAAKTILALDQERDGIEPAGPPVKTFDLPVPRELSFLQGAVRRVDGLMMWASLPHPLMIAATPLGWFAGAEVKLNGFLLRLRRGKRSEAAQDAPAQDAPAQEAATSLPATDSTAGQPRDDATVTTSSANATPSA
jgi:hypothetical protein